MALIERFWVLTMPGPAGALNRLAVGSEAGGRTAEQRGDSGSPASTSGQTLGSPGREDKPTSQSLPNSKPSLQSLLKSQSMRPRMAEADPSEEDRPPAGALQASPLLISIICSPQGENVLSLVWIFT